MVVTARSLVATEVVSGSRWLFKIIIRFLIKGIVTGYNRLWATQEISDIDALVPTHRPSHLGKWGLGKYSCRLRRGSRSRSRSSKFFGRKQFGSSDVQRKGVSDLQNVSLLSSTTCDPGKTGTKYPVVLQQSWLEASSRLIKPFQVTSNGFKNLHLLLMTRQQGLFFNRHARSFLPRKVRCKSRYAFSMLWCSNM